MRRGPYSSRRVMPVVDDEQHGRERGARTRCSSQAAAARQTSATLAFGPSVDPVRREVPRQRGGGGRRPRRARTSPPATSRRAREAACGADDADGPAGHRGTRWRARRPRSPVRDGSHAARRSGRPAASARMRREPRRRRAARPARAEVAQRPASGTPFPHDEVGRLAGRSARRRDEATAMQRPKKRVQLRAPSGSRLRAWVASCSSRSSRGPARSGRAP